MSFIGPSYTIFEKEAVERTLRVGVGKTFDEIIAASKVTRNKVALILQDLLKGGHTKERGRFTYKYASPIRQCLI